MNTLALILVLCDVSGKFSEGHKNDCFLKATDFLNINHNCQPSNLGTRNSCLLKAIAKHFRKEESK